ncbi:MAG TPA: AbrB/MazE/SpoVT family DNA-binding domain-containing protein [Acidobacteriota bacterium]|nr:AbrB/MazE/SpoVT family DNA-binding domain-containing protein [Acidobacteriota bacterium]
MREVKLSSKNQIVIPREAREALQTKPGDKLLCIPRGNLVIVIAKPKKYSKALRGLARAVYAEEYLDKERNSWE